jgi:hypothetical protein
MDARANDEGEGLSDFLQACRRVLTAGVLARDRGAVLSLDPSRWPRANGAGPGAEALGPERAMIERGEDLQLGLAAALDGALSGSEPDAAAAGLLELLVDCARARFVYEETAMRLRGDPARFEHVQAHGWILERLGAARGLLRARRAAAARAVVLRFREDLATHASTCPGAPAGDAAG